MQLTAGKSGVGIHHYFRERKCCLGAKQFLCGTHLIDSWWGDTAPAVLGCWVPALHWLGQQLRFGSAAPCG